MGVIRELIEGYRENQWPHNEKKLLDRKNPKIWEKHEWRALKVELKKEEWNIFPLEHVTVTHTRSKECHSHRECFLLMQELQRKDIMENDLLDIKHNYYIGSDFEIYEGRGWLINSSRDPEFQHLNRKSCDIAYIGDFSETFPPAGFEKTSREIMRFLVAHSLLTDDFLLTPFGAKNPVPGPDVCRDLKEGYRKLVADIGLPHVKYNVPD